MKNIKLKPEAIRLQLGLSQREFSKILDLDVQQYRRRVRGKTQWKASELALLSHKSKIPMDNIDIS